MPYQCFFSYARKNRNDDLNRFVADLRDKILLRKRFPRNEVLFFDGDGIEAGAPWKQELSNALRTSRVFIAICSPDYINSDYCGKEFHVFLERYRSYLGGKPETPKLIIPVLWGAPSGSLREVISEFQYTDDDFPAIYAQEGLRYMMELKAHADDYKMFVTRLAQKIVDDSFAHPLPDLSQLRSLESVKSAFHVKSSLRQRKVTVRGSQSTHICGVPGHRYYRSNRVAQEQRTVERKNRGNHQRDSCSTKGVR